MQNFSLQSVQLSHPISGNSRSQRSTFHRKRRVHKLVLATKKDANSDKRQDRQGKLVDENMIVLRMRIQEMKIEEQKNSETNSDSWMEWERELYKNYDSDVYEVVGLFQNLLMNSRSSFVLGMVALLIFSTSTSLAFLLCYLLDIVQGIHV